MDILFNPLSLSEDDIEQLRSVLNVERFTRLLAVALPTLPEQPDDLKSAWELFSIGYAVGSVLVAILITTFPADIVGLFGPVSVALYFGVRYWMAKR